MLLLIMEASSQVVMDISLESGSARDIFSFSDLII